MEVANPFEVSDNFSRIEISEKLLFRRNSSDGNKMSQN